MASEKREHRRTIRSYVKRAGRMTASQQKALEELWPQYGIDFEHELLDLSEIFHRSAPCIMEIGFGNGETLAEQAREHPDNNYLGVEVHEPGIGHLFILLRRRGLRNVRVICRDAVEVLTHQIPDASLHGVNIYFPDPWPKKRHHKRRLVQAPFADLLAKKIRPGGKLHLATDWEPYAEQMLEVMEANAFFENASPDGGFSPRPPERPVTKFETRGEKMGHGVWDLIYVRRLNPP